MSEERHGKKTLQIHQRGKGHDMIDANCSKDFKVDIRGKKSLSL